MSRHTEHRQAIADLKGEVKTLTTVVSTQQGSMDQMVNSMTQLNDIARMHNEVLATHTQRLRELAETGCTKCELLPVPTTEDMAEIVKMEATPPEPSSYSGDHAPGAEEA